MTTFLLILVHVWGLIVGSYCGWYARRNWERNSWTTHANRITCPPTERERAALRAREATDGS